MGHEQKRGSNTTALTHLEMEVSRTPFCVNSARRSWPEDVLQCRRVLANVVWRCPAQLEVKPLDIVSMNFSPLHRQTADVQTATSGPDDCMKAIGVRSPQPCVPWQAGPADLLESRLGPRI